MMKNKIQIMMTAILYIVLFTACSAKETSLKQQLEDSGLSNIDTYLRYVEDYKKGATPEQDYNCRTTAFMLLEDSITANPKSEYDNYLMFDMDAIQTNNDFEQIRDHEGEFIAVFDGASVEGVADNQFEQVYPKILQDRQVAFNNDKAALISVVMHDPDEKKLFVGHAGVLIPQKNGFLFLEKIAPFEEYRTTLFSSKSELKNELLSRPEYYGDGSEHEPMVYENGVLIE